MVFYFICCCLYIFIFGKLIHSFIHSFIYSFLYRPLAANREVENYIEGEKKEMVEIYQEKGMDAKDAEEFVDILAKYPSLLVDVMMVDELGMMPEEDESPVKNGIITFLSFIAFGMIPLMTYILFENVFFAKLPEWASFIVTICVTLITLFVLGAIKGKLTNTFWLTSGLLVVVTGSVAAALSYGLGALMNYIGTLLAKTNIWGF